MVASIPSGERLLVKALMDAVVPHVSGQGSGRHGVTISTGERARSAASSDS